MAVQKPLVRYGGSIRQLGAGDYIPASAIQAAAITPATGHSMPGGTVQDLLATAWFYASTTSEGFSFHVEPFTGIKHAASAISNVPSGGISATTLQGAVNQLDSAKFDKTGGAIAGAVSAGGLIMRGGGGEGGQVDLNNPDNASVGGYLDVAAADTVRLYSVRNNAYFLIGQLGGNGGTVALATVGTERLKVNADGTVLAVNSAGLGYGLGSGGTVNQATSKSTAVTLNKPSGEISMHNGSLAAGASVSFTFNNSFLGAADGILIRPNGFTGYAVDIEYSASATSVVVRVTNLGATRSEAVALPFQLVKGATS